MPTEHFKSKEAYRKNMAYRHMHGIPFTAKNVVVGGKEHAVEHSGGSRAKLDAKQRAKEYHNPSPKHAPHNPGRITHVHQHLQTEHTPPHKGKTVDGHDHDGHVAGSMPEHDHHGLIHHYTHQK